MLKGTRHHFRRCYQNKRACRSFSVLLNPDAECRRYCNQERSFDNVHYHQYNCQRYPTQPSFSSIQKRQFSSSSKIDLKGYDDIYKLPPQYLRNSCDSNYDKNTHQRIDVPFDIHNGKPPQSSTTLDSKKFEIIDCSFDMEKPHWFVKWGDGATSFFSDVWVRDQIQLWKNHESVKEHNVKRVHWANLTETHVRASNSPLRLNFSDIIDGKSEEQALRVLYRYGILLVTNTPIDDGGEGVAALAASVSGGSEQKDNVETSLLGWYRHQQKREQEGKGGEVEMDRPVTVLRDGTDGPLRTLFGNVWSTHSSDMASGASTADSAYGNDALPLHTDMTYFRDPPGLQIFTMVNPATNGGESIFADGFAAAERLRITDPESFDVLCSTIRQYRSLDYDTGWHLEGKGPVISAVDLRTTLGPGSSSFLPPVEQRWGPVTAIRHNDLDRLPDLPFPPPPSSPDVIDATMKKEHDEFYEKLHIAHSKWDDILGSNEFRLVMNLQPGDTVLVANQRCLHGRTSFSIEQESRRAIMGCYISQVDLDSRFRRAGFQLY